MSLFARKQKNEHPLQNLTQAEVMAYYLIKGIARHQVDIDRIKLDLMEIEAKWGVNLKLIEKRVKAGDWITP